MVNVIDKIFSFILNLVKIVIFSYALMVPLLAVLNSFGVQISDATSIFLVILPCYIFITLMLKLKKPVDK